MLGVVWEAPQTLLGLVNLGIELARGGVAHLSREEGRIFVELRGSRAISLGHFIFWSTIDAPIVRVLCGRAVPLHEEAVGWLLRWLPGELGRPSGRGGSSQVGASRRARALARHATTGFRLTCALS
jgi:hypothetical protein